MNNNKAHPDRLLLVNGIPCDPIPIYCCAVCSKSLITKTNVNIHLRQEHYITFSSKYRKQKCTDCLECGNYYSSLRGLILHLGVAHGLPKYKCDKCPAQYSRETNLHSHLREKHDCGQDSLNARWKCDVCPRSFISEVKFVTHKRAHSDPTISCSFCELKFYHRIHLVTHMRNTHTIKSCGKKGHSLVAHLRTHYQRPLKCDKCGQIFINQTSFGRHLRDIHGVETITTFKCDECSKGFSTLNGLRFHKSFHSPPQIRCPKCSKMFYTYGSLSKHSQGCCSSNLAKSDGNFSCAVCLSRHQRKYQLIRHILTHTLPDFSTVHV